MKVIVAGSRGIDTYDVVEEALALAWLIFEIKPTVVVSGGARGVDRLGEHWAHRYHVKVSQFIPQWKDADGNTDRSAGFTRNKHMGRFADALVAVWDGQSKGTGQMIQFMLALGKPVYVHLVPYVEPLDVKNPAGRRHVELSGFAKRDSFGVKYMDDDIPF